MTVPAISPSFHFLPSPSCFSPLLSVFHYLISEPSTICSFLCFFTRNFRQKKGGLKNVYQFFLPFKKNGQFFNLSSLLGASNLCDLCYFGHCSNSLVPDFFIARKISFLSRAVKSVQQIWIFHRNGYHFLVIIVWHNRRDHIDCQFSLDT